MNILQHTRRINATAANGILIMKLSGATQTEIARSFEVSTDTVLNIQRKNPARMQMFVEKDGKFELADKSRTLVTSGELVVQNIEITGNPADGIIVCNELYHDDYYTSAPKSPVWDYSFNVDDIGIVKPFRVGVLKIVNKSCCDPDGVQYIDEEHEYENVYDINSWDKLEYYRLIPNIPIVESDVEKEVDKLLTDPQPNETTVEAMNDDVVEELEYIWNATNKSISISYGLDVYNADYGHENFKEALTALINGEFEKAVELINIEKAVTEYVDGNIEIKNGQLLYKGLSIRNGLSKRIVDSMMAGEDFKKYLPFLENLMLNPSNKAVMRLFDFLEANDVEITDDGYFLAWKRVGNNYMDLYEGKYDNSVGKSPEMPRNMVDEDDETTCSRGLHVCSRSYLDHYACGSANKTMIVKVHPRDVVSIPVDYNNAKMRTCKYEVIEDATHLFA